MYGQQNIKITSYIFGACYTITRVTIALRAQELYAICNVATQVVLYNVKYTPFLIYSAITIFKSMFISSLCVLKILKMLVAILNGSTLISVGYCCLLRMLATHVFTVSSCVWYVLAWRS